MKIIAFYLPQFHEIAENNEWWGEGFTEWTNTKKAKPLFKNHYQPREPLNNNYYDLSQVETLKWQASLAKKYNIYGFCFYHYWFDSKLLLQKPSNNLLSNKDIDLPFCFSWANETWTRAWDGKTKQVLIEQKYGLKEEWKKHFDYLLPFFQDTRYIKIDNKPVFIFYRSSIIPNCNEMMNYWMELANKNGLNGIYFITTLNAFEIDKREVNFDARIEFEPMYTRKHHTKIHLKIIRKSKEMIRKMTKLKFKWLLDTDSYDQIWMRILKRKKREKNTYLGAFIDWDNTPRKKEQSTIIQGSTPQKFQNYLTKQIILANKYANPDFLFINAWNEWAEGTYLEPDKKNSFGYLNAIKSAQEINE